MPRNEAGSLLDSARLPVQNRNITITSPGGMGDSKKIPKVIETYKNIACNSWLILGVLTNRILNKWRGKNAQCRAAHTMYFLPLCNQGPKGGKYKGMYSKILSHTPWVSSADRWAKD